MTQRFKAKDQVAYKSTVPVYTTKKAVHPQAFLATVYDPSDPSQVKDTVALRDRKKKRTKDKQKAGEQSGEPSGEPSGQQGGQQEGQQSGQQGEQQGGK